MAHKHYITLQYSVFLYNNLVKYLIVLHYLTDRKLSMLFYEHFQKFMSGLTKNEKSIGWLLGWDYHPLQPCQKQPKKVD